MPRYLLDIFDEIIGFLWFARGKNGDGDGKKGFGVVDDSYVYTLVDKLLHSLGSVYVPRASTQQMSIRNPV